MTETVTRSCTGFVALLLIAFTWIAAPTDAAEEIDMPKVRAVAERPVTEILGDAPVPELPRASYQWGQQIGSDWGQVLPCHIAQSICSICLSLRLTVP